MVTGAAARIDLASLGPAAFTMSGTAVRREVLAAYLALPSSMRPSSAALGAILGCDSSTVRGDWRRPDVIERSGTLALEGLAAVMLAAARAGLVIVARAAAGGDQDALAFLLDRLDGLGLAPRVLDPASPRLEGGGAAAGVLPGEDDAERALALMLEACAVGGVSPKEADAAG